MDKIIGVMKLVKAVGSRGNSSYVLIECVVCGEQREVRKYDFLRSKGKCTACGAEENVGVSPSVLFKETVEYKCNKCGIKEWMNSPISLDIDHIVPISFGGSDSIGNLQYLCPNCHRQKTAKESAERYRTGKSVYLPGKKVGAYEFIERRANKGRSPQVLVKCVHCEEEKVMSEYNFLRIAGQCTNCYKK